jgi:hypothetical protein
MGPMTNRQQQLAMKLWQTWPVFVAAVVTGLALAALT